MRLPGRVVANGKDLTVYDIAAVGLFDHPFKVVKSAAVAESKRMLDTRLAENYFLYGVNTNYGKDVSLVVSRSQTVDLQKNLIRSLLCGASASGEWLEPAIVKGAMLARINCLCKGYSAVRPEVIDALARALGRGLIPCVPSYGSVGASGDLIPSAYIANFLFGGFADDTLPCYTPKGIMPLHAAYREFRIDFIPLAKIEPKECLSIINSVSFCASIGSLVTFKLRRAIDLMAAVTAFASQAVRCFAEDFNPYVQELRSGRHSGAVTFARKVWDLNKPSPLLQDAEAARRHPKESVPLQDAYALGRCVSQHLDSFVDLANYAEKKLNIVLNSIHDNPIVDPDRGKIYHSGNFYAGDIASRMDYARIEAGKAAKFLHALVNRLLDEHKNNGLGANLVFKQDGTQNGFKGLNLLSTALATSLSGVTAISPLTLPTERENQDIVSLGFETAKEAYHAMDALETLIAVALISALQAFDLRMKKEGITPSKDSLFNPELLHLYRMFRTVVPFMEEDASFHVHIERLKGFLKLNGHSLLV